MNRRCLLAAWYFLSALAVTLAWPYAWAAETRMKVLHHAVVNDTIVGAQCPCGLVKDPSDGSLVLAFQDRGDVVAGTVTHFVRSVDGGKSWGKPFASYKDPDKAVGAGVGLVQLPTGRILAVIMEVAHTDLSLEGFKHLEGDKYVLSFYSADKSLPGRDHTYVDSNVVEIK